MSDPKPNKSSGRNGHVPWWRRVMFVGVGGVIVWVAEWFMSFMDRIETVDSVAIGAATGGIATVFVALLILFFLLAIGTYSGDRLSSLVEGGKETLGRLAGRDPGGHK